MKHHACYYKNQRYQYLLFLLLFVVLVSTNTDSTGNVHAFIYIPTIRVVTKSLSSASSILQPSSILQRASTTTDTDTDNEEEDTVKPATTTQHQQYTTRKEYDNAMLPCLVILTEAAVTKQVSADRVYNALITLEQLARRCNRMIVLNNHNEGNEGSGSSDDEKRNEYGQSVQDQLTGSWRLIFTTGTSQSPTINYFPIKAIQTFNTTTNVITNAIYIGDYIILQFIGTFDFNIRKCQLQFDFDTIRLFQNTFTIPLKSGQAAEFGAKSGLGSKSNVINIQQKKKKAFFNWISANDQIATARGGGGGLALWKRI